MNLQHTLYGLLVGVAVYYVFLLLPWKWSNKSKRIVGIALGIITYNIAYWLI